MRAPQASTSNSPALTGAGFSTRPDIRSKPPPSAQAVARISATMPGCRQAGMPRAARSMRAWQYTYSLRNAGLDYGHEEYLRRGKHELNIAVLSRFPIVEKNSHTDDTYTIGPAQFPVLRGFIDIVIEECDNVEEVD